jgi:hypothetical protein
MRRQPKRKARKARKAHAERVWYSRRRAKNKVDWAGANPGDAFRTSLSYHQQLKGRQILFAGCTKAVQNAVRHAGVSADGGYTPKTKPQLGPLYTRYPTTLSACAVQGLTAFLEYREVAPGNVLRDVMSSYLEHPAAVDHVDVDPDLYKKLVLRTVDVIQTRLLLHDLGASPGLNSIEFYRLFACSQQTLSFSSLPQIIEAVVLYGDLLPDLSDLDLHPTTSFVFDRLTSVSAPFQFSLAEAERNSHVWIGEDWVRALARAVARLLPRSHSFGLPRIRGPEDRGEHSPERGLPLFEWASHGTPRGDRVPPLGGPRPPALFDPPTVIERAMEGLGVTVASGPGVAGAKPAETELSKTINDLRETMAKASGKGEKWENPRADHVEREGRENSFQRGSIEGTPTDGHSVDVRWQGQPIAEGDLYDRPLALSDDLDAVSELTAEADPLVRELRQLLYLNTTYPLHVERHRTSGALDPSRLALTDVSAAVFRQYRLREEADPRGNPVVLVACDGSGSLTADQMRMAKLFVTAWLLSTAKTGVQLLAGLYHSGNVHGQLNMPLIQWIYHPHKSAALGNLDAVRGVASLPPSGTGAQSDALSLAFMLEEARTLARGKMIYLILISDTAWNRCSQRANSGEEEMVTLFSAAAEEFSGRLHTTLVALGVTKECGLETLVDRMVTVSPDELKNPSVVASSIGTMVASCMRERRKGLRR